MKFFKTASTRSRKEVYRDMAAGFGAGTGAAVIMNPLDIYNTKVQAMQGSRGLRLKLKRKEMKAFLRSISFRNGLKQGLRAYTAGLSSKALKVGGASAITYSLYEGLKRTMK